jgi:hypothetical protein
MTTITSNLMPTYENTLALLRAKRTRLGLTKNQLRHRWFFTNPQGEHYIFASFKRAGETATVCTVAWYNAIIGVWLPL